MAVTSGQVAIGITAVRVYDAGDNFDRLIVQNTDATNAYLGGSGVTTATGYRLAAGVTLNLQQLQDSGEDLYAIATVSSTLHYLAY